MGIFDEKGVEIIDYTLLRKKGILKVPEIPKRDFGITGDEFVDLSNKKTAQAEPIFIPGASAGSSSASDTAPTPSFANFFGDASPATDTNSIQTYYGDNPNSSTTARPIGADTDLSALKIKIEDVEYKLERLIERLDKLESTNK